MIQMDFLAANHVRIVGSASRGRLCDSTSFLYVLINSKPRGLERRRSTEKHKVAVWLLLRTMKPASAA